MQLILGVIASFVTFPTIYYTADLSQSKPNLIKWCVAFQNGYFLACAHGTGRPIFRARFSDDGNRA
jgi:hypothetical protein